MKLDDKLREILMTCQGNVDEVLVEETIPRLKQAFEEAGYVKFEGGIFGPKSDKMSGQAWYDRFVAELLKDGDIKAAGLITLKGLEAAKRAAGL